MDYLKILKQADEKQLTQGGVAPTDERIVQLIFKELEKMNIGRLKCLSGGFQDTAYFAQILITHGSGAISKIVFSEASGLVGISNETELGAHMPKIVKVIRESGAVYAPESILRTPYSGQDQGYDSWWHRFFDYQ